MQIDDRQLESIGKWSACSSASRNSLKGRLPKRIAAAASLAIACLFISTNPANAGWRNSFSKTVLPSLVRRAAVSLIHQELYDLESDRPSKDRQQYLPASPTASSNANSTNPDTNREISTTRQASGYWWTPRPATDYLSDPDDEQFPRNLQQNTALPAPFAHSPAPLPRSRPASVPSSAVAQSFQQGLAGSCSYEQLVSAGVFESDPLHGSVFKREGRVRYIILHSTETGSPADARRVILSWNNRGLRHPGAQFVVDRDGAICSTTNPDMATVHIDTSKALAGYSNDNSVGIEIVRSGKQQYTRPQLDSVTCLVSYLQAHYGVPDSNVTTHHHVQPSDRSDPVGFDLVAFENDKSALKTSALAHGARFDNPWQSTLTLASGNRAPSRATITDTSSILSTMPKPAPDFRLRRN